MKNLGTIRGGSNQHARFILDLISEHGSVEELAAEITGLLGALDLVSVTIGCNDGAKCSVELNTRRDFAALPAVIRHAQACGLEVSTSQWDVGIKGSAGIDSRDFWHACACAQAWFRE